MAFSATTRQQNINRLQNETLDLLIIGGGITGAGVAIQASAMNIKTGLIDMQDFAEGTSSRSTKLVHGGIRYLKTFDVGVVADTVKERAVVQGIAPHIPKPDPMLLPIYNEGGATFDMFSVKVAMDLYDQLAAVTDPNYTNYTLSRDEVLQREPQLDPTNLVGGGVYLDYRNNDARLVIENIKKAHENGGIIASHVKATGLLHDADGRVIGVMAHDQVTDTDFEIHARIVINTTGPWSDTVRQYDQDANFKPQMRPTKGVHLVVDAAKLPVPQPTYFDSGDQDGRMIFVVPRENKTYFGTTDTDYHGDFAHPTVTQEDVDYLLSIINRRFPSVKLGIDDIESSWAGLRPLIAANGSSDYNGGNSGKISDKSFDDVIDVVDQFESQKASREDVEEVLNDLESSLAEDRLSPSAVSRGSALTSSSDGLLTLAGGKLTDYRKMAAGAMALIRKLLADQFDESFNAINSKNLPVSGGDIDPNNVAATITFYAKQGTDHGLTNDEALQIANLYGSNAARVFSLIGKVEPTHGLSVAETISLRYALDEEMTLTPVDYLLRRTNHLLFMRDSLDSVKDGVIATMADYLGWDAATTQAQTELLNQTIAESDLAALKQG